MRKWRWVSRDTTSCRTLVDVWEQKDKPVLEDGYAPGTVIFIGNVSASICAKEFRLLFGFCPKPGECIQVEFSARIVAAEKGEAK